MPYRIRLDINNKIRKIERKKMDMEFPVEGKEIAEEMAKIFPIGKSFSSDKITIAILKALNIAIKELFKQSYDETIIKYAGGHLIEKVNDELRYLRDINNYDNRYKIEWSTRQN